MVWKRRGDHEFFQGKGKLYNCCYYYFLKKNLPKLGAIQIQLFMFSVVQNPTSNMATFWPFKIAPPRNQTLPIFSTWFFAFAYQNCGRNKFSLSGIHLKFWATLTSCLEVKPSPVDWQFLAQTGVNDLFLCSELATGTLCNYRVTGRCIVFQDKWHQQQCRRFALVVWCGVVRCRQTFNNVVRNGLRINPFLVCTITTTNAACAASLLFIIIIIII